MAYLAPNQPGTPQRVIEAQPSITVTSAARCVVAGTGFLPNHEVTVHVSYTADDASDFITFTADAVGQFRAELPTSADSGTLHITATDHRRHYIGGAARVMWSNTETIDACGR